MLGRERLDDKYDDLIENGYRYDGGYSNNLDDNYGNNSLATDDNSSTTKSRITEQQALQVVLKNLNVTQDKIYDLDFDLEYKARYNTLVYEVSFDYNNYEYEYYLDAYTGKILDSLKSRDF